MSTASDFYEVAQGHETAASAKTNWRICAGILIVFIVAATLNAFSRDIRLGFDEVAHVSFIADVQRSGELWPRLEGMRMLDPSRFRFTGEANYLNHPPAYYVALAHLGPALEGHPEALIYYRLLNVALAALGLAALLAIGATAALPRLTLYAYIVPLACIPVLAPLAGSVNNDNAAFAAGGAATLAAWQLLRRGNRGWLLALLASVIAASWTKLTGLLLAGGLASGVLAWLMWCGRLPLAWLALIGAAALLAIAPYVAYLVQYGSPAPNTSGQIGMLKSVAHASGWDRQARLSPGAYAMHFMSEFVTGWTPTVTGRSWPAYAVRAISILASACAFAGWLLSARRIVRRRETPIDVVVAAGMIAFAGTLLLHGIFSYQRHLAFGWMMDAYPRYYLPLAAIMPLAGLSLLAALKAPRSRTLVAGFLIAAPVATLAIAALLAGAS